MHLLDAWTVPLNRRFTRDQGHHVVGLRVERVRGQVRRTQSVRWYCINRCEGMVQGAPLYVQVLPVLEGVPRGALPFRTELVV